MTISSVVLAAGSSSRLGSPKQLLDLDGKPVLQHVLDLAWNIGDGEIIVVLGHDAERVKTAIRLPPRTRTVVNERHREGQSSSLKVGLGAVDTNTEAALVLLGDQPTVEPSAIDIVLSGWRRTGADVARARYDGVPGHPVVIARRSFGAFAKLTGDAGARPLIDRGLLEVHDVNLPGPPPVDIDTREDYEALLRGRG
jgi:molybdenum cofactor cytidylyltransferase